MTSLQEYLDEHLMCEIIDERYLSSAALIGFDGNVLGRSEKFPNLKADEIEAITKAFQEPGSLAKAGLHLGGVKYTVTEGVPGAIIRGKRDSGGATVAKFNSGFAVGIYDEPVFQEDCNFIVEQAAEDLKNQGK